MCWEQRSREQWQLFPTEPSLPLSALGTCLTHNSKAHGSKGNMSPDTHCKNFTSSGPFPWNSNIRNLTKKWSNTMGLSYFLFILFIFFPPQTDHRDIHCSTRASEDHSPVRPCLWEGLSYLLFVLSWSYIFHWKFTLYLGSASIAVLKRG